MALSIQKLIIAFIASLTAFMGTNLPTAVLSHKNGQVLVELAQTPAAQQQGLSGRKSLGANQGMLFIFPQDEARQFWMKEMNFPLDIIWLNKEGKIMGLATNVATSTYPGIISSPGPVRQVLEVSAGYAQKYGLTVGDFIR